MKRKDEIKAGLEVERTGKTERGHKVVIINRMKALGTYDAAFDECIKRLAALYTEREEIEEEMKKPGFSRMVEHTNKAGNTNLVKNPLIVMRAEVTSRILEHEKELGLTPAALKRMGESAMKAKQEESPLAQALRSLSGG